MGMILDRKFAEMVWRIDSHTYEVRGLPNGEISPEFKFRSDAEKWLAENLDSLGLTRAKRGLRACLCCRSEFESEGIHNRLCNRCRCAPSAEQTVRPYITRTA